MFGRIPAKLRPALAREERVLGWAAGAEGGAAVVTTLGLWLPGREQRLGWHEIHKAAWAGSRLTVIPAVRVGEGPGYEVMADGTPVTVNLVKPGDVPIVVRQRVTKSVAYTAHHPVSEGGVRVVARRVPGVDGLRWQVRYDEGTDATAPEVVAATEEFLAVAWGADQGPVQPS